jgi:peptide/nickel transport system substrate-binding protein
LIFRSTSGRPVALRATCLILTAAIAMIALSACGSGSNGSAVSTSGKVNGHTVQGLYGSLPAAGTPTAGGTITMGQLSGDTPTYLFPIIPGANATDGTGFLIDQLYIPLYNLQVGGSMQVNYATSAALPPKFSDGDKRVTIQLRPGLDWSNGQPVTANDVLFSIAILKAAVKASPANWDQYTPGLVPDNIASASAANQRTVVLTFTKSYNPAYLLGNELAYTLIPMPSREWDIDATAGPPVNWHVPANAKKIYEYLNQQGSSLSTFSKSPLWKVVDGPFALGSFSTTNGSFSLNANPRYTLTGKVRFSHLAVNTYTSATAQLNALRSGALDVGVNIDFSELGSVPGLRDAGYAVYGYPNIGTFGMIINFKDKTGHFNSIIGQLYVRQALAHLIDQPAYIKGIFRGAAAPAYGPLPTLPKTPFTPADAGIDPYPYSVSAAAKLLRSHGWKVVAGGQTTCAKAGTGPGDCGAGIPAGTPLTFKLWSTPAGETVSIPLESDAFATAAKQVGVQVQQGTKTFNFQIQNFNNTNPAAAQYTNQWAMANWGEYGTTPYPTGENLFNTSGSSNMGAYSSPTTDALINSAIYGKQASAATAVADHLAKDVPMLFLPCADVIDAVSNKVGGTTDSFLAMTQDVFYPQYWYVKKSA